MQKLLSISSLSKCSDTSCANLVVSICGDVFSKPYFSASVDTLDMRLPRLVRKLVIISFYQSLFRIIGIFKYGASQ